MSEEQESSVLFSLKELMSIEEERIRSEEEEAKAQKAAAEQARLEAEQRAREEEAARLAAEEERRRLEEQRAREEAARLQAIQQAEMLKAQQEAEQHARMAAMTAQQEHERALATITQDRSKKRLRIALIVGAIVVVLGGSTIGYFVYQGWQQNLAEKRAAEERERLAREEAARKEKELKDKLAEIQSLRDKLAAAPTPEEKAELMRKLDKAETEAAGMRRPGYLPTKKGGDTPKPKCRPGDPLCSDI
jgi:colicin import membrane protein